MHRRWKFAVAGSRGASIPMIEGGHADCSRAFDQAQLGVTVVGDLIEGVNRATIIAAAVGGFGRIGSAVSIGTTFGWHNR